MWKANGGKFSNFCCVCEALKERGYVLREGRRKGRAREKEWGDFSESNII
jgi:hypothetical protein